MRSVAVWVCILLMGVVLFPSAGIAEGISREQGDAILEELRQIRVLLERQPQRPGPMLRAPVPPVPPPPEKKSVPLAGGVSEGRADAPVTIVEYSDFQCSFCARFQAETYPDLKKNFIDTGKVRLLYRDLPLEFHAEALRAAQAGRCAGEQGKFPQMRDLLSKNAAGLVPESYASFARDLSLDPQAFKSCMDSEKHLSAILASRQDAAALEIRSTPTFVVGTVRGGMVDGVEIKGALPYSTFEKTISDLLKEK